MIKFYRKIRQNLLSEGKTSKYFKYAIGEIVLVVIGILIALSINNWNQNLKNRDSERILLTNIQNDISLDTLDLNFNNALHKKALKSQIRLLRFLDKDPTINSDSINYSDVLPPKLIVVIHKASFNNMTYNNPDLIRNKDLKKKIDRNYDYFYPSLIEAQNNQTEYNFYAKILPYYKKYFKTNGSVAEFDQEAYGNEEFYNDRFYRNVLQPIDVHLLQNDREFAIELSEAIFLRSALISMYDNALTRIKTLHRDIDIELDRK
ncbi:DUF6090 family protein [Polaribacter glomeratus]|uniref:Uncharacterized protein n=1 Tax=Polaribacter glomeratus TaxID=102 RepID=A0A2S7WYB1_9FLAO|nr:DUF6090 family protein [Polaribacter glomeratus]PQJ82518.1 hypothetical protein BTO16_07980 [Polaribacter glomeratus]TXD65031.1 hypothetical protein ESX12_12890 [Polaribacter glomeratus]